MDFDRYCAIRKAHKPPIQQTIRRLGKLRAYFDQFECQDAELIGVAEFAWRRWRDADDEHRDAEDFRLVSVLAYCLGAAHALGVLPQPEIDERISRSGISESDYVLLRWEFARCETLERAGGGRKVWKTLCRMPLSGAAQAPEAPSMPSGRTAPHEGS